MIRFFALTRREVSRFVKIKGQTIGAPLLETFLYISVFGAALGTRVGDLDGVDYVVLRDPRPDPDGLGDQRFHQQRHPAPAEVPALDRRPAVFAGTPIQLLLAFTLGGFLRGMTIAIITFLVASVLVDLPVEHPLVLVISLFLVGFFFSQLGVLVGIRANSSMTSPLRRRSSCSC